MKQTLKSKFRVIILQHPQEPREIRSTAQLTHQLLENSILKIGLSWKSLSTLLGEPVVHSEWGVLYLGTQKSYSGRDSNPLSISSKTRSGRTSTYSIEEAIFSLKGFVVLDGTWAQAKTLWWRNPWLLKLKRMSLRPAHASLYNQIRKEPRKECLSTIEAVAMTLEVLQEKPEIPAMLSSEFESFLKDFKSPTPKKEG